MPRPPTRRHALRRAGVVVLSLAVLLGSACGGADGDGRPTSTTSSGAAADGGPREGLKIAFLPKQLDNPYSDLEVGGGETAVRELEGGYTLLGPNDANASSQVSYINQLTRDRQDVVAIAANDPDAVCPSLGRARKAGIKVVTFDSDSSPDCRDLFVNQASTQGVGESLVAMVSRLVGGEGKIAILSATPNATNQNAWIDVVRTELTRKEHRGLDLVEVAYGDDEDGRSFDETRRLIEDHPDLAAVVAPTTVGIEAAARYVSGSAAKGKVQVTGLGTPNRMRPYVKNGTVSEFALWDPADLGYLTAYAGAALASGLITGAEGESFAAGRLGEYTVGPGREVVLGPPTVFDADNIDDFDF